MHRPDSRRMADALEWKSHPMRAGRGAAPCCMLPRRSHGQRRRPINAMKIKLTARKLQMCFFLLIYGLVFGRPLWLMTEGGARPAPMLFLMACCAVWFGLINLMLDQAQKSLRKKNESKAPRRPDSGK